MDLEVIIAGGLLSSFFSFVAAVAAVAVELLQLQATVAVAIHAATSQLGKLF